MSPLAFSLVFLLSNPYETVQCLICTHSALPTAAENSREVQLALNCSSNRPVVTTIFNIPPIHLHEYTILYTCKIDGQSEPIRGEAISRSIINKTEILERTIPCGSLCTFGGCYLSGTLGNVVDVSIPSPYSCFVCSKGQSGVCTTEFNRTCRDESRQCVPSLNLDDGLINCNCSFEENCPTITTSSVSAPSAITSPPTIPLPTLLSHTTLTITSTESEVVEKCSCNCFELYYEGYNCNCSGGHLNNQCNNISGCVLNFCGTNETGCEDLDHSYQCFCKGRSAQDCTNADSFRTILTSSLLVVSLLLATSVVFCCLLVYFIMSKNSTKKENRKAVTIPPVFDEMCTHDPVDVAIPKYRIYYSESFSSFSSLFDAFPTFLSNESQNRSSAPPGPLNTCTNSKCHNNIISDAESYIVCPCSSSAYSEVCHYCQGQDENNECD